MNNSDQKKIVTRFAPSPTGFLHIGGVRTALYAWLFARQNSGKFILRIEDTDKAREVVGSISHIKESLQWFGLNWDYGPDKPGPFGSCLQSERLNIYKQYAEKLIAKGLAYPDPYTTAELSTFRAQAAAKKQPFLFRNHRPEMFDTWDGTRPLRFKIPEIKRYIWTDTVRGELSAGAEMLDDFILIKSDGYPTYNFAHIIDDFEMGVTHVMRADEFISSTPKFLSLYEALEIPYPVFVTLPPIMGPDGKKKLSKRDGARDLLEYRTDGYLPVAMRNFLALVGWNPGGEQEIFPNSELITAFSLTKIQRSGGAFNEEKLLWMNKKYLDMQTDEFKLEYFISSLPINKHDLPQYSVERAARLCATAFERARNQNEIHQAAAAGEYDWAFTIPEYDTALLQWKNNTPTQQVLVHLKHLLTLIPTIDFSSPETLRASVMPYADSEGRGEVLWPLRIAVSGKKQSPDPFTIAYIIGQSETVERIQTACAKITDDVS